MMASRLAQLVWRTVRGNTAILVQAAVAKHAHHVTLKGLVRVRRWALCLMALAVRGQTCLACILT